MVNVIDSPVVTTATRPSSAGKVDIRFAGACLCAAACLTGVMSSPSVPMVSKPIYSSRATLTSTNPTPTLVYDNGDFTVFFTNVGGASLDIDVTKSLTSLNEISRLETNWNGNGAESFSSQLITKCRSLIKLLKRQPDIFPTAQHSIQLEWENPVGDYMEIELFENDSCQMALRRSDGTWVERTIEYTAIGDSVEKFFARTI